MLELRDLARRYGVEEAARQRQGRVTAFIPMTAPITTPPRIVMGIGDRRVLRGTLGAAALLIALAARIYEGGILRTGSALKLREAWRAARA